MTAGDNDIGILLGISARRVESVWLDQTLRNSSGSLAILTAIRRASLHLPRIRFFRRLSPFPSASLPVVAGDTALDHFVAPAVACDDEAREVSAAEANRAERNRNENLTQQLAHGPPS
jgi:hypothetical protein